MDYEQGLLLHALPQAPSRFWDLLLEVARLTCPPRCPRRTCGLAEPPPSLIFPAATPSAATFQPGKSRRSRQGPLRPGSRGDAKGWDSLGMSQIRLRNALFPGDWHRELFFPQCSMEGRRVCFQKKKNNKKTHKKPTKPNPPFSGFVGLHSAQH